MPTLGPLELAIILVIVVLIFGAGKLPELGSSVGKTFREFRSATKEVDEIKQSLTFDKEVSELKQSLTIDPKAMPPAKPSQAIRPTPAPTAPPTPPVATVEPQPSPAAPAVDETPAVDPTTPAAEAKPPSTDKPAAA